MKRLLRLFARDERAVAALEFALLAPMLIGLYIGSVELTLAFQAQQRMAHMAAAMADMASQDRTISTAQLDDIMTAGQVMVFPLSPTPLGQRISSLTANAGGTPAVDWTRARNFSGQPAPATPTGYLQANESVIVADVIYEYRSIFGLVLPTPIRFVRHAYYRPRLSDRVEMR